MKQIDIMLKKMTLLTATVGLFLGLVGCLEKEDRQPEGNYNVPNKPFGLFVIHLTLIDHDTKEPITGLLVKPVNARLIHKDIQSQRSDETGTVHLSIAAAPPIPQEFILSYVDTVEGQIFNPEHLVVRFADPVFIYLPKDANMLGWLYQGTTELTLTRELKRESKTILDE